MNRSLPLLQRMHTQGLSLSLAGCVKAWLHFSVDVQSSVCDLSYILPCTDQMFPLLSDCVCSSWTLYIVFWSLESRISFKEFILWELLETLLYYHLKEILSLLSLLTLKIQLKKLGLVRFFFFFLKEFNTQQGCIKFMKSDSKYIYNIIKDFK